MEQSQQKEIDNYGLSCQPTRSLHSLDLTNKQMLYTPVIISDITPLLLVVCIFPDDVVWSLVIIFFANGLHVKSSKLICIYNGAHLCVHTCVRVYAV